MKDKDEFLKQMETLQVPDIDPSLHQQKVKMTIMNAERSAVLSLWLLMVPCYSIFCLIMVFFSHSKAFNDWFFGIAMEAAFGKKSWHPEYLILVGGPCVSIIINTLALVHVQYHKLKPAFGKTNELTITIKLKTWNIVLLFISLILAYLFIFD